MRQQTVDPAAYVGARQSGAMLASMGVEKPGGGKIGRFEHVMSSIPQPNREADSLADHLCAAVAALLYRYGNRGRATLRIRSIELKGQQIHLADDRTFNMRVRGGDACSALIEAIAAGLPAGAPDSAVVAPIDIELLFAPAVARSSNEVDQLLVAITQAMRDQMVQTGGSGSALRVLFCQSQDQLHSCVVYDVGRTQRRTAELFAIHLNRVVQQILFDASVPVRRLEVLGPRELVLQTQQWQGDTKCFGQEPVFRRFELMADVQPLRPAIVSTHGDLTYAQLNDRANCLAQILYHRGVRPADMVAVCLHLSPDLIATMLAVFKLGAVYVPLDTDHPQHRIGRIVSDCDPRVIVTRTALVPLVAEFGYDLIDLSETHDVSAQSADKPDVQVTADDLAYVIYTSGSTGRPKGVLSSHSNLINNVASSVERYGLGPGDVMPALARHTFSITMFELLAPLVGGAAVRLLDRDEILDSSFLAAQLQHTSVVHIGPSLLDRLLAHVIQMHEPPDYASVRYIVTGGDFISLETMTLAQQIFVNAQVVSTYGCSETSAFATGYTVPRPPNGDRTYVGRPIANTQIRLLDEDLNLVPVGVVGEIYVSGAGVSPGYLHNQILNQTRFVQIDGCRFFRTGDLGRLTHDGQLEIHGRGDFQVKIRGVRIETAEVEMALRQAPGVEQALVMPGRMPSGEHALFAYIKGDSSGDGIARIRDFLSQRLPGFMCPAGYIELTTVPLNHNMKVDRLALPAPTVKNLIRPANGEVPGTDTERVLARIWRSLLNLETISIDESFHDLGGSSLLAAKVIAAVATELEASLPVRAFVDYPTLRTMASYIDFCGSMVERQDAVVLKRGQGHPILCLYGIMLYRELAMALPVDQPLVSIYLQEELDLISSGNVQTMLERYSSIDYIVERYTGIVRSVQQEGPYHLAGVSFGGVIALEVARNLRAAGHEVSIVALMDTWVPGFGRRGPIGKRLRAHSKAWMKRPFGHTAGILQSVLDRYRLRRMSHRNDVATNQISETIDPRMIARQRAVSQFEPRSYDGRVVLYRALTRSPFEPDDPQLGWTPYLTNLTVVDVPGDHIRILEYPNVAAMAHDLGSRVKRPVG